MAQREEPILSHSAAWDHDSRKRDARKAVGMIPAHLLRIENARHIAATYRVPIGDVEAAMMRRMQEGSDK